MKDTNDKLTIDMLPTKRGRGRPRKDGALTGAQRQAAYRAKTVTLTMTRYEACQLWNRLDLDNISQHPELIAIRDRLLAILRSREEPKAVTVTEKPSLSVYRLRGCNFYRKHSISLGLVFNYNGFKLAGYGSRDINLRLQKVIYNSLHYLAQDKKEQKSVNVTKNGLNRPVKYRHPYNPDLTWTGRGRKPMWIIYWLQDGNPLSDLEV